MPTDGDPKYLATQLAEGSLEDYLAAHPKMLTMDVFVVLWQDILLGLKHLHTLTDNGQPAPIIHRDLKVRQSLLYLLREI